MISPEIPERIREICRTVPPEMDGVYPDWAKPQIKAVKEYVEPLGYKPWFSLNSLVKIRCIDLADMENKTVYSVEIDGATLNHRDFRYLKPDFEWIILKNDRRDNAIQSTD